MLQRITSSGQLPYPLTKNKPDDPYEKYVRAKYMYQVIKNIKAQKENLSKEEMLSMLEQAVDDYTNSEGFVMLTGENKPNKPSLTRVK